MIEAKDNFSEYLKFLLDFVPKVRYLDSNKGHL